MENESLKLLPKASDERLHAWLKEFYGKNVDIVKREVLRHRDLSYVERIQIKDGLPESIIYKLVLPPWDIEQDLHECVLIPSICNSATLFMTARDGNRTALFMEDLGPFSVLSSLSKDMVKKIGEELAKLHRAYSYRIDELSPLNILPTLFPIDYEVFTKKICVTLISNNLINQSQEKELCYLARLLAKDLAGEPISLVHGDLYAENLIVRNNRFFIIDWSWFTHLGVPLMDLATLAMNHPKNGAFYEWRDTLIESYCFESGHSLDDVKKLLPAAETLSRLFFLHWLVERRNMGIMGTTVGHVDILIKEVLDDLFERLSKMPG